MRTLLLTLALALTFAARAGAQAADTDGVRPGDRVRLAVWRQPEFTGEYAVGADGAIQHPLLTSVRVVGATREQVRERIRAVLAQYESDPQFVFDFLYRVGVGGEVRLPSLYNLPPETTIVQALAAAGGATAEARLDRARLYRDGRETEIDLLRPTPEVATLRIRSGDQLTVPRRRNAFRESLGIAASLVAAVSSVVGAIIVAGNN